MKKSQAWSMDIMIAMVIFIGVIFVFYTILSTNGGDKRDELMEDALRVMKNINITEDVTYVDELLAEDYTTLKKKFRIKNDFCIYFEDANGNVIRLNKEDLDQLGIGSDVINISDTPCK